jgi:hypothetical protein
MVVINCLLTRKIDSVGYMDSTIAESMNARH